MPNVTGMGTSFNLPNYSGLLATASPTKTPFLSLLLRKPIKTVAALEFATMSDYTLPNPSADGISENAAADIRNNVNATNIVRGQETNIIQTFTDKLSISYIKQAASAQMAGLNIAGQKNNIDSEIAFQRSMIIKKNATNIEYAFLNGSYNKAGNANQVNKTRGMFEAIAPGNVLDLDGTALTRDNFEKAIKTLFDNGAYLEDVVVFVDSNAKQKISRIYEATPGFGLPVSRTVAGVAISDIVTDFGTFGIVLDQWIPKGKILFADLAYVQAVQMLTNGSNFYFEDLAKQGAAYEEMFYGLIGLDYGPNFCHAAIIDIAYGDETLKEVTLTSVAGESVNESVITITSGKESEANTYYYKVDTKTILEPTYGAGTFGWVALPSSPATIDFGVNTQIMIAEVTPNNTIIGASDSTLLVKGS